MNNSLKAHLSLLTANLIYAANFSIAKELLPDYIPASAFILLRVLGALILFWIVGTFFIKEKTDKKDLPKFALLGLVGVAINQLLFFKGLSLTAPINGAIMMISSPVLVVVISAFLIRERISKVRLLGIVLGFAGAALLLNSSQIGHQHAGNWLGDLYIFINALSWSFYMVLVKPLMQKYNTFTIVKWVFLFGFIYVLPFGYPGLDEIRWADMDAYLLWCLAFVIIATTFFAYLLNTYALRALSASVVSAYIYLQPFLAALIAITWGKDSLNLIKVASALLIFTGVYLVNRQSSQKTLTHKSI